MKRLLLKLAGWVAVFLTTMFLSEAAGTDPVWYLLGLWLWKDLSDAMEKETGYVKKCGYAEARKLGTPH